MIQYALKCADDHSFDSWFQSASAFEKLDNAGLLTCAICGSAKVSKAVMAPRVSVGVSSGADPARPLSAPASAAEQAVADLRKKVEDKADYVGADFATEARAIHDGSAPKRMIYGEAKLGDAKKLIEEGVPVAPLPFAANRKTN